VAAEADDPAAAGAQLRERASWLLCGVLAALFLVAGVSKVVGVENVVDNFDRWGYSEPFRFFIGFCEILGAIGLLLPRISVSACAGLAGILLGALYTHLLHGESPVFAGLVLALVCSVVPLRWSRAFFTWTPPALRS